MSLISMMEARLPPGFRFHPRDDELVLDYLCRKLSGKGGGGGGAYGGIAMVDVDLNKCEPWDLPGIPSGPTLRYRIYIDLLQVLCCAHAACTLAPINN
jgi:hypothetical protein